MHAQVRVVVSAWAHVGQRVHEGHRPVVVREGEGLADRGPVLDQFPAGQGGQAFGHGGGGELVLRAFSGWQWRLASSLIEVMTAFRGGWAGV